MGWITKSGAHKLGVGDLNKTKQRNQKLLKCIETSNYGQEKGGDISKVMAGEGEMTYETILGKLMLE